MKLPFPASRALGVYVDRITTGGIVETARFLGKNWDRDSPITNILRFEESPLQQQWNEAFVKNRIACGTCLKAVKENGEMVGAGISKIVYKDKPDDPSEEELSRLTSMLPKIQTHNALLKKLFDEADLFSKYQVNTYMDLGRSYVVPEYRRYKLGWDLLHVLIAEIQKTLDVEVLAAVATSVYSQKGLKAVKEYPFELVHEIDFATYKVGEKYPFKNDGIHQSMQLYVTRLPAGQ